MIHCAYVVMHAYCNKCHAQATWCPGLTEHNREIGLFEMLTPEYLIEAIPNMDGLPNYKSQKPKWRIDEAGNAFCPEHA